MKYVVLIATLVFLAGCATLSGSSLSRLSVGMPKDEVIKIIGTPTFVTAARKNDSSNELWEYETQGAKEIRQITWLAFQDKKLVAWGRAADFTNYSPKALLDANFLAEFRPLVVGQQQEVSSQPVSQPLEMPAEIKPQEPQGPKKNFSP